MAGAGAPVAPIGLHLNQDFRQRQHADHQGQQGHAVLELDLAESHARGRGFGVEPHGGKKYAEHGGGEALDHRAPHQGGDEGQGEQHQGEQFRRPHVQRQDGEGCGDQDQNYVGEKIAEDRGIQRHFQRLQALALAGQGIAVEGRRYGLRRARDIDQAGGNGAAEIGALVDADQEGDGGQGPHEEGQGNGDGDGHGAVQAGNRAHGDADEDAEADHRHIVEGEGVGQSGEDNVHNAKAAETAEVSRRTPRPAPAPTLP
jgi:hypothetical protein